MSSPDENEQNKNMAHTLNQSRWREHWENVYSSEINTILSLLVEMLVNH